MECKGKIYVARIVYSTSTDGVGLRNSLYVSGCSIHCDGCHNKAWWKREAGEVQTVDDVFSQLNIDQFNISILGGEPLEQYDAILSLCKRIKRETDKTIWMWSGYTLDYIKKNYGEILKYIDILIDGPYIESLAKPNLQWRGSTNQKVWNVKNIVS